MNFPQEQLINIEFGYQVVPFIMLFSEKKNKNKHFKDKLQLSKFSVLNNLLFLLHQDDA